MDKMTDAFTFHGVLLSDAGEQARGDCPFCLKEQHFYVKQTTGQWQCQRCLEKGNIATFLNSLWESSFAATWNNDRSEGGQLITDLAEERGLSLDEMKLWGMCFNTLNDTFLIPAYNLQGKLANITKIVWSDEKGKWIPYSTPGCKQHPFGTQLLTAEHTDLDIAEGFWDGIALSAAHRQARQHGDQFIKSTNPDLVLSKTHGVIATPGSGTFQREWIEGYCKGRHVRFLFDNDHPSESTTGKPIKPGWDGMNRAIKMIHEEGDPTLSIQRIQWGPEGYDPDLKDGYDIRDIIKSTTVTNALTIINGLVKKVKVKKSDLSPPEKTVETVEPLLCESFDDLCEVFDKCLHFNTTLKQTLAVSTAVVLSTRIASDQLFFRMLGPAGSGKTTLAECLSVAREYVYPCSVLTGLHSGHAGVTRGDNKRSGSLFDDINDKCFIMKEGNTLITAPNREKILAEFRDLFDGVTRNRYRNGRREDLDDLRNTIILCGTDELRELNRTSFGERFLDIDIVGKCSTKAYLTSSINAAFDDIRRSISGEDDDGISGSAKNLLKRKTYGYLRYLHGLLEKHTIIVPEETQKDRDQIEALAVFLSKIRTRVKRDGEDMLYRPRPELATRLSKQFVKLALFTGMAMNKSEIAGEIMGIVQKVVLDSAHGYPLEIADNLYKVGDRGASLDTVCLNLGLPKQTLRRVAEDMQELKIIERRAESNNSGIGGRNAHYLYLTNEMRSLYQAAGLSRLFHPQPLRKA